MQILSCLGVMLGVCASVVAVAQGRPVRTQPVAVAAEAESAFPENTVMRYVGFDIIREPTARDSDFDGLYAINLEKSPITQAQLLSVAPVYFYAAQKLAVMKLSEKEFDLVDELIGHEVPQNRFVRIFGDLLSVPKERYLVPPVMLPVAKDPRVEQLLAAMEMGRIKDDINAMEAMKTRFHSTESGKAVAQWLKDRVADGFKDRPDASFELYDHGNKTPQKSFILRIKGTSGPDEVVVIGAHIDSTSSQRATNAPGGDDDASGVAVMLETMRVIASKGLKFARTVEFHGYAAEELGLVGSQDIATAYQAQGKKVIAMLQNDMNLFRDQNQDKIFFVTSNTNTTLTADLIKLTELYLGLPTGKAPLSGGTSDHQSWTRKGFPAAFPTENPANYNRSIHTPADTLDTAAKGNVSQPLAFAKLNLAFLATYAGAEAPAEQKTSTATSTATATATSTEEDPDQKGTDAGKEESSNSSLCSCVPGSDDLTCTLVDDANKVLAWTPLAKGQECDEAFCKKYFVLGLSRSECTGE